MCVGFIQASNSAIKVGGTQSEGTQVSFSCLPSQATYNNYSQVHVLAIVIQAVGELFRLPDSTLDFE